VLYGKYLDAAGKSRCASTRSCGSEIIGLTYAARQSPVRVSLESFEPNGNFTLRTEAEPTSPIMFTYKLQDLKENDWLVLGAASPGCPACPGSPASCNLLVWQVLTGVGALGWVACLCLLLARARA